MSNISALENSSEIIVNIPVKAIVFPNIDGDFKKFSDMYKKITEKSGNFDLVFLTGNVFNSNKDFSLLNELEKLSHTTKFIIFDSSEVGIVCKHKLDYSHQHIKENITILGRSGIYSINGLKIAYINGKENKKYLSEDDKYKYTSCYFSRDDVDYLIDSTKNKESRVDILLLHSIPSTLYDEMLK
jgi:hypothetical protein